MAEVAKLVGKEVRDYVGQDGRQRRFCGLHLVYVEGSARGVEGCKVESVSCPHDIDPLSLKVGEMYQLVYEVYTTRNGKAARLVDLLLVES